MKNFLLAIYFSLFLLVCAGCAEVRSVPLAKMGFPPPGTTIAVLNILECPSRIEIGFKNAKGAYYFVECGKNPGLSGFNVTPGVYELIFFLDDKPVALWTKNLFAARDLMAVHYWGDLRIKGTDRSPVLTFENNPETRRKIEEQMPVRKPVLFSVTNE